MLIWCDKVNLDVVWTEKYKGSSEKTVRVLIYQWKYAKCFIWNFINLNPPPSLHLPLSLFLAPTLTPPPSQNTHTEGDKSHCEPSQFPVLMTSCLQTRWTVSQGSWSLTPSHAVCRSLISYPSIQKTFDLMKHSCGYHWGKIMNTEKGCSSLGNIVLQLEPEARTCIKHNVRKTFAHTPGLNLPHTHTNLVIIIIPKSPNEGKMCYYPKGKFTV